jgi:hypothetical protein
MVRTFGFYTANILYPFLTNHKYANTHVYAHVRFIQPNSEQPVGAKQAGCELFNARSLRSFFSKKQRAARWREKSISGALPNARLLRVYFLKRLKYAGCEPANDRQAIY